MSDVIYNRLKSAKTIDELIILLNEEGLKWNESQVELYLKLDSRIKVSDNKYYVEDNEKDAAVLDIIEKAIQGRPMIQLIKIMELLPEGYQLNESDIRNIALASGKYKKLNDSVIAKI